MCQDWWNCSQGGPLIPELIIIIIPVKMHSYWYCLTHSNIATSLILYQKLDLNNTCNLIMCKIISLTSNPTVNSTLSRQNNQMRTEFHFKFAVRWRVKILSDQNTRYIHVSRMECPLRREMRGETLSIKIIEWTRTFPANGTGLGSH